MFRGEATTFGDDVRKSTISYGPTETEADCLSLPSSDMYFNSNDSLAAAIQGYAVHRMNLLRNSVGALKGSVGCIDGKQEG